MSPRERLIAVMDELAAQASDESRAGMARYGINVASAFGVSVYELRRMAKALGADHDLALALWDTGNHEARMLAGIVDDPAAVTEAQMEEWVKRAAFATAATLAVQDKAASDERFLAILALVRREAGDGRNFVKKAVNWALRNIGKRNAPPRTVATRPRAAPAGSRATPCVSCARTRCCAASERSTNRRSASERPAGPKGPVAGRTSRASHSGSNIVACAGSACTHRQGVT